MKLKKRIVLITVLLALMTTALAYYYIEAAIASENENVVEMATVVVPINTIPENVELTAEMLEVKEVPAETVHADAFSAIDELVGGISTTELFSGEQILHQRVVLDSTEATLAYQIPENMRAVTLPMDEYSGVAGYITKGDLIDLTVTYARSDDSQQGYTQLQGVKVLALGPNGTDAAAGVPTSLTLLVTPEQAEVIAYAKVSGSFQLTLRNPTDTEEEELPGYGSENFDSWKER